MAEIPITKIYGASDDLIEVEGAIHEEFAAYSNDDDAGWLLAFSDGTLLRLDYDSDGLWRIKRISSGACSYEHEPGDVDEDRNDVVTLRGALKWCVLGMAGDTNPARPR